jgi:membrane protease subunit HflC
MALWVIVGLVGLVIVVMMTSGQGGFVEIGDTEVGVVVNYLTGETELVNQPGYKVFLPFVERVFLFDRSPQKFEMSGDRDVSDNHVEKLTVRADDGSNFWFDDIEIQYEMLPSDSKHVLSDSGPGNAFKVHWVRAFARSILRDEFGRFSAAEVADPTIYKSATMDATLELNRQLNPHGVKIVQIITPKPRFDVGYEKAIEDRKVADQEVERIKARAIQLIQERGRRLAQIDAAMAVEYEALKGELAADRILAEKDRVRVEKSADAFSKLIVADGEATRLALTENARGMTEKARKEAEGLQAIIEALEKRGEVLVRERLAQRLSEVQFTLVPYTRDTTPDRIELSGPGLSKIGEN